MIKAVIFDCFGVLVGTGFEDTYREMGGDVQKDAGFIHTILRKASAGLISHTDFRKEITSRVGIDDQRFNDAVSKREQPNYDLFDYIKNSLKSRYKIGLLSNANVGTIQRYIPEDLRKLFDEIIVSAEVGMLKPDPEIYQHVAEKLGIEVHEALFVDDRQGHVAGAEAAGMKAILYSNFDDFKTKLENMLGPNQDAIGHYLSAIRRAAGENANIVRAKSGLMNFVFLVDEKYVFRFPKNDEVLAHQLFEQDICNFLCNKTKGLDISIPKPLHMLADPHSFVYEYIPGHTIEESELLALNDEQKIKFITDILTFINWLGNALSKEQFLEIANKSEGERMEAWTDYINRTIAKFEDSKYSALTEINRELLQELKTHYPNGIESASDRVIHDDLHMGNLLFNDNFELTGVIDFGAMTIGDLPLELRHFYRLSPEIARQAIDLYQQKFGEKVDFDKVAWWAKVNDAATLTDKIMTKNFNAPSYIRAKVNLAKWYPKKDWNF